MPSEPPSASPTAIAMAATRTIATVRSAVRSGGCYAAETTPPYKTCALRVLEHRLRPAKQVRNKPNRSQSAIRAGEAAAMVDCQKLKRPEAVSRVVA